VALRILHIGKYYPPARGGMEVFLADLVQAQRAQGIEAFALVHGEPVDDDPDWLTRVPVQGQLAYAPVALGFRAALVAALNLYQPTVLHLHMPNNAAFWAMTVSRARGLPWVVHWHSDVVFPAERKLLAVAYRIYRPFEQSLLSQTARIFVTSPPYLAASQALAPWRDKCVVIPLGLGQERETHPADTSTLPWRKGRLRVLSVGRLTYYKGFETLIRAFCGLAQVDLVIAGAGELHSELQSLIRKTTPDGGEPTVQLLGEVSEAFKHELLRSCDIFCLASRERSEAFGLVLLEAMLHARPCLVSDLPGSGMPWLVQEARCGELVELDDEEAWRRAVLKAAADPERCARQGAAGLRALNERFTANACARSMTPHYESLVGERRAGLHGKDILIVIPARDEAPTIGDLIESLAEAGWTRVLVVDDHSSDNTSGMARAAGAQVLQPVLPMGAWGAMQCGIRWALAQGYQAVVTMDADGQHEVSEIPHLLRMRDEADLVVGAFVERASRARRIAWRWFVHLTGLDLEDLTSGFRYYNRAAMRILASEEATLLDYQDLGTLLLLRRAGLRIREVPVAMKAREIGKSRIFKSWLNVGRYMAVTTLLCLSRWRVRRERAG
jgi:glycosyltransferase involved in cell wall biosynthesis